MAPRFSKRAPRELQAGARLAKRGQYSSKCAPTKPQNCLRLLKDVPRWSQAGISMAQNCLRCVSQAVLAFILGLLGRSLAVPSFRLRLVFALLSRCLRFAFGLPPFYFRSTFALPLPLCFFALPLPLGGFPEAIRPLGPL